MITEPTEEKVFRNIFRDLKQLGKKVSPRGQLVIELENYSYTLPPRARFCNFECRNLNLDYIKKEFLWYLRGNRFDREILKHAKMWANLVNADGSINSNYGQYIFFKGSQQVRSQFDYVVKTLADDLDSRRASMVILNQQHLLSDTKDYPCTYSLNFRVRAEKLNMSVHMRSQDAVFGMGNDAPCFSFIHEMVYSALKAQFPELQLGTYHHTVDSFHVYERHFEVMEKIAGNDRFIPVECPPLTSPEEVKFLRTLIHLTYPEGTSESPLTNLAKGAEADLTKLLTEKMVNDYPFSTWLTSHLTVST